MRMTLVALFCCLALIGNVCNAEHPLEVSPRYWLQLMDNDIEAVSRGNEPSGSFTDVFVPNAGEALKLGATRREVNVRIERAVGLAKKGKYISLGMKRMMDEGGPVAVREYADSWIKEYLRPR